MLTYQQALDDLADEMRENQRLRAFAEKETAISLAAEAYAERQTVRLAKAIEALEAARDYCMVHGVEIIDAALKEMLSELREKEIRLLRPIRGGWMDGAIRDLLAEIDRLRAFHEQTRSYAMLSDEREKEIRAEAQLISPGDPCVPHSEMMNDLLAEIDRLRADLDKTARDAITYLREKTKAIAALEQIANPPPHANPDWAVMQARQALKEIRG